MSCGDNAHIDADRGDTTHALELLFLQEAQQFGLSVERAVADLVQENRAPVGQFEPIPLLGYGKALSTTPFYQRKSEY